MCSVVLPLYGQDILSATGPHIKVSLLSENDQFTVGQNRLGVLLEPDPQWHTYWRNPGDSGDAPSLVWTLPEGVSAGDISWPVPQEIYIAHLVNYGYEGAVLLMVPITVSEDYNGLGKPVAITLDLSWLVCKEDCIPGWATLSMTKEVKGKVVPSFFSPLFKATDEKLPTKPTLSGKHEITEQHIVVSIDNLQVDSAKLLPFDDGVMPHNTHQSLMANNDGTSTFLLPKSDYLVSSPDQLTFLMIQGNSGIEVVSQLNIGAVDTTPKQNLWILILMAFAGGLILNLMPCVLPILAIKALSLKQVEYGLLDKLAYFAGVLVSFNLFALVIVLLRGSGNAVGWGFHMQEPIMVALLAFLFVYIALLLLNIAPQGHSLTSLGQMKEGKSNKATQFMTGVLAVIVASPCTAPFMAAALGVALISPAPIVFTLFSSLAVGFALPMTLLYFVPRVSALLPKPGPWMENVRQFLAFPMLATVIWLVWLFLQQTDANTQLGLLSALLVFSMTIWIASRTQGVAKWLAYIACLSSVLILVYPLQHLSSSESQTAVVFDQNKLASLKNANQVVLVNMTADWCVTCKVNEKVAFDTDAVKQAG